MSNVGIVLPPNIDQLKEQDLRGKKVLVRVDYNTPISNGEVADATKIEESLKTIQELIDKGAQIALISHLGRPSGEGFDSKYTMQPVAKKLQGLLNREVVLVKDIVVDDTNENLIKNLEDGKIVLFENSRFNPGEEGKKKRPEEYEKLCKKLADTFNVYVNDAFGTAHRDHATTAGLVKYLDKAKKAVCGLLMKKEVEGLTKIIDNPEEPLMVVLGGSKVEGKADIIESILENRPVKYLSIGGAMAYTFLYYKGVDVGNSLVEHKFIEDGTIARIFKKAEEKGTEIILPIDHIIAKSEDIKEASKDFANIEIPTEVTDGDTIKKGFAGVDIGPKTIAIQKERIAVSKTIVCNGSQGIYENKNCAKGTDEVVKAIADSGAKIIVGGGDAIATVNKAGVSDKITHISTGGGATLELLAGFKLPGIQSLINRIQNKNKCSCDRSLI